MKNEQLGEIFNKLKENILTEDYNGENTVIQTENVVFQISTLKDQKNNDNPNISTIDLGECENILKKQYNIPKEDSLIVVKTDIKSSDLSSTYVQYEIYDPNSLDPLDMNYCKEVKIAVSVPANLNADTLSLYDSLSESGYNLFNSEDDFYNDICTTFTSANGTDMTLEDRKKEIFAASGNLSMCQVGCIFESYNKTTKKAKCDCEPQSNETETDMSKINFDKKDLGANFLSTLKNSNFLVLKCYKLVFDFSNIIKNKGRIIMSIILIMFLLLILVYWAKDRKKITVYIQSLIKSKIAHLNNSKQLKFDSLNLKDLKNKNKNIKMQNFPKKSKFNQKLNNKKNQKNKKVIINKKNNNIKKDKNGPPRKNEKNFQRNTKFDEKIKNSKISTNSNSNNNLISSTNIKKINKKKIRYKYKYNSNK